MRIDRLEAVQPPTPGSPGDWRTQLGQLLVRVVTADGLEGIGVGSGGAAGIHIIDTVLREVVVGHDLKHPADIHEKLCRHTAFYGRKGIAVMAISGVDLALWDLFGKQAGKPIASVLAPDVDLTQSLPTYATVWDDEEARVCIENGAVAVKLHVERFGAPPDVDGIVSLVSRTRKALGAGKAIMMDAFGAWDVSSTLQVARGVERFEVDWIEEPVQPDDAVAYKQLMEQSPVPIAGGEHEYLSEGFQYLVENKLHAVLQPDINWCGGLTTLVQIYRMAALAGLRVCPHRGSEPYALQAIAALDPKPLAESPRDWFTCLEGASMIQDGRITVPDRPGFGVVVDKALWNS